jgi:dCMP deaminase
MPSLRNLDRVFLNIAKEISQLSNCVSHQVGCVIVNQGRIISQGYNGTPAGFMNCNEVFDNTPVFGGPPRWDRDEHHEFSEDFEIHAEQNAILFAAKHGICIDNSTLYCTLQPCKQCLKMICQSGIFRIVYDKEYDKNDYTKKTYEMLETCGVELVKWKSGYEIHCGI